MKEEKIIPAARRRGDTIRHSILNNLGSHPRDIVTVTAGQFGVSRQAINKHMKVLAASNLIKAVGVTRNRTYMLAPLDGKRIRFSLLGGIEEDETWRGRVASFLRDLPTNVMRIWSSCFSEMAKNAADHSKETTGVVSVELNKMNTKITNIDDGVRRKGS